MNTLYILLTLLVMLPEGVKKEKVPWQLESYFDSMEKACKKMDADKSVLFFAEKFDVEFTQPNGVVEVFKRSRNEHLKYLKNFLAARPDYQYNHELLRWRVNADGTAYGKLSVTQSYTEEGKKITTQAVEELHLKPKGDSFEATKMVVKVQVVSKK